MPGSREALEIVTHEPWIRWLLSELGHEVMVVNCQPVDLFFCLSVRTLFGTPEGKDIFPRGGGPVGVKAVLCGTSRLRVLTAVSQLSAYHLGHSGVLYYFGAVGNALGGALTASTEEF